MKLWHNMLLFCSFLPEIISDFQGTLPASTVELSLISGSQPVCHDKTVVYSCSTTSLGILTWNFYSPLGEPQIRSCTFDAAAGSITDEQFCQNEGQYAYDASLQIKAGMNLTSLLVIPYTPEWNGTTIQCMEGLSGNKSLLYVTAGSPTPPSSVQHTITEHFVNLNWSTCTTSDTDCHLYYIMVMITVGDDNLLNTSYQAGMAIIDVSKYLSNDSIKIKLYGINAKCNMKSSSYTEITVELAQKFDNFTKSSINPGEIAAIVLTIFVFLFILSSAQILITIFCTRFYCV